MPQLNILEDKKGFVGPTFSLANRLKRFVWLIVWLFAARWTPPSLHRWRIFLLRIFGAKVSWRAYVYPSVEIWAPWNLTVGDYGTLGRNVVCYNIAKVHIGTRAVISQGAQLCTGTHDYRVAAFPLIAKPIFIGTRAWVCANAFVGPGVTIADGCVLAAAAVTFRDLEAWTVYVGNPATAQQSRPILLD